LIAIHLRSSTHGSRTHDLLAFINQKPSLSRPRSYHPAEFHPAWCI
jgi:hypothetical protein